DLSRYPRNFNADKDKLKHFDPVVIFYPRAESMYPSGFKTSVEVPDLADKLCGKFRPGHFKGVATVVAKLFNIVSPDYAFFGEKDFQQQIIIKKMAKDLNYGVEIISIPTVREYDGLAMSSRNAYLSPEDRKSAAVLYRALCQGKKLVESGIKEPNKIVTAMTEIIGSVPLIRIEYLSIVDPETLEDKKPLSGPVLIAAAVWLGKTRLIDNITVKAK
ncbi:MAG: pantoate--beta-alanine ligase, partial [Candidatus Margulisiibacteriota bacterium]